MIPLVVALLKAGLPAIAGAVFNKGKELVEEKTGIKLPSVTAEGNIPDEALVPLQKIEADKQVELQRLANERERIDADDRGSARLREIEVKDWVPGFLATSTTFGFFGILAYAVMYGFPENGREPLLVMLGALGGAWGSVMTYYYGSSASSRRANEFITKQTAK